MRRRLQGLFRWTCAFLAIVFLLITIRSIWYYDMLGYVCADPDPSAAGFSYEIFGATTDSGTLRFGYSAIRRRDAVDGSVSVQAPPPGWILDSEPLPTPSMDLIFEANFERRSGPAAFHNRVIAIPAWLPAIALAIDPILHLIHRRRRILALRRSQSLCPTCGYDLRASKDRCPECGTAMRAV